MVTRSTGLPGNRQDRRKAATRARILAAAEELFGARGYAETSMEDISETADVAVRTIYTHFPSKAAILLASFDGWVDAFVAEILRRPLGEPVIDTVRVALEEMARAGWADHPEDGDTPVHPMVVHLHEGAPDVAGHVLQRWMRELERLTRDAIERGDYPEGSLEPHARAVAVFAAWVAAISAAAGRERGRALPGGASGNSLGLGILGRITDGAL